MFLFTGDYFLDTVSVPGGLSEYISTFLIQFFINPWAGAAIMACAIASVQYLIWKVSGFEKGWFLPLTFLPSLILTAFHCDEMAMLSADISVIAALCLTLVLGHIPEENKKLITSTVMVPVMFYAFGSTSLLFILPVILRKRRFALWGIPLAAICPIIAWYITHLPLKGLLGGLHLYRTFDFPFMPWAAVASAFIIVMTGLICSGRRLSKKVHPAAIFVMSILTCAAGWLLISSSFKKHNCTQRELTYKYAFLLLDGKWDTILADYEEDGSPSSLFPVVSHNMALAKKGRLADEMFKYPQNGTQSLIPKYKLDFFMPLVLSGIHLELGLVNEAQRYAFEALQSIPFFHKSARCYRILAMTNQVNQEESVAKKYLNVLTHTMFYRKQAFKELSDLNSSPVARDIGERRLTEEHLLFSENDIPEYLSAHCEKSPENPMVLQYLLCYIMLQGDINSFREHFETYYHLPGDVPEHYAEALLVGWTARNRDCSAIPWNISPSKCDTCLEFMKEVMSKKSKGELRKKYGDTYWYYLLFNNQKK